MYLFSWAHSEESFGEVFITTYMILLVADYCLH